MYSQAISSNVIKFLLICWASVLPVFLVLLTGWYSLLIAFLPFFIWLIFRYFKHATSTYIFLYMLIHFSAFTVLLPDIGSYLRLPSFLGIISIVTIYFMFTKKELEGFRLSIDIKVLLFLFFMTLILGAFRSLEPFQSTLYLIWFIASAVFIFFYIPKEYGTTESIMKLLYVFVLAGLVYEIGSLFTLHSTGISSRGGNIAIRGLFTNNNTMGMIAFLVSALSFVLLLYKEYFSRKKLLLIRVSVLLSPTLVVLSSSRSSILGLVTTILLLGLTNKKSRKLSIGLTAAGIFLFIFGRPLLNIWFRIDTLNNGIFGDRTNLYDYVIRSLEYIPWHGLGIGMQEHLYHVSKVFYDGTLDSDGTGLGFHNSYLQIIVEGGVVGFLLFVAILWSTFAKSFTVKDESSRRLIWIIWAVMGGMMVNCFFESALLQPGSPYAFIFWTLICLVHIVHYRSLSVGRG